MPWKFFSCMLTKDREHFNMSVMARWIVHNICTCEKRCECGLWQTLDSSTLIGRFKQYFPDAATSISWFDTILKLLLLIILKDKSGKRMLSGKEYNLSIFKYKIEKLASNYLSIRKKNYKICQKLPIYSHYLTFMKHTTIFIF